MTPIELRLGNIIYDDLDRIAQVSHISLTTIECIVDDDGRAWTTVFRPKPVPISDDIIIRFGFSDEDYKMGYTGIDVDHTDFVITKPTSEVGMERFYRFEFKYGGWERAKFFKYAHELQNFFFVLYNKELKLK